MLKKSDMIPGAVVVIKEPKSGVPAIYGGSSTIEYVSIFESGDATGPFYPHVKAFQGDRFRIVKSPRKIGRTNLVRVKNASGVEGEVYWCELRASAKIFA